MKTYLLDFDGTLVDSMPTFVSVMLRILDENHVAYGDDIIKIIPPSGPRRYGKVLCGAGCAHESGAGHGGHGSVHL